jgi:hypothetical protein
MASPCVTPLVEELKTLAPTIPATTNSDLIFDASFTWMLYAAVKIPARLCRGSSQSSVRTYEVMGIYHSLEVAESKKIECEKYYQQHFNIDIQLEIKLQRINRDLWNSKSGPAICTIREPETI